MRKRYELQVAETDPTDDTENYTQNKYKSSIHGVPVYVGIIFVALLFGVFGIVYLIDGVLPTGLTIADEKNYPNAFIAERAQNDLKVLTEIGPRVVGSYENEALTVDYLKRKITFIQHQAHPNQKVEMDIQMVSGSYLLEFKPHGGINAYANVQNIIVKLHSKNNSEHSLLVNAHFDSVPTSPGGSDDGINCVVMLEILRKLAQSSDRLQYNVIFLFNGAEETPLQASHGFITQHKWAKEARVLINLEAAGSGNKEILFQLGPGQSWLINYYGKVPHPNGQAAGEELFQTGLIPSDTDFRIFRDFGGLIGLDMAFARNGYRYHTKYDNFANIPLGSYQHMGDNVLSLVRNLANAPELPDPKGQPAKSTIYFDFLGLFMVSYSATFAIVINVLTIIGSTIIAAKAFYDFGLRFNRQTIVYVALATGAILLGWIISCLFILIIAFTVDGLGFSLSWYGNPWIIFGLYVAPIIACCFGVIILFNRYMDKDNLSISAQTQIEAHLIRSIWSVPLLIGTICGFRFVYSILIPVLFHTLTFAIIQVLHLHYTIRKWQIIYILGTIIPNMFLTSQAINILSVIIPICGRMGSDRNPELYIGMLVFMLTIIITSFYVCLITLVDKSHYLVAILGGVFVIFFVIVFTPLGFPYDGNPASPAPQRYWIFHTGRTFRNDTNDIFKKDAGFFLLNLDRNSPHKVKNYVKDISKIKSVADDCKQSLFCGLPISSYRMIQILDKSTWIPAEQPKINVPIQLKLNSKIVIDNVTRFNFSASGPDRMVIYLSPKFNITLKSISLVEKLASEQLVWNDRPIYAIMYTWGQEAPLTFSLDFQTPNNWNFSTFDIGIAGVYVHDKTTYKTPHYSQFLKEFPDWADVTAWVSSYESWVY